MGMRPCSASSRAFPARPMSSSCRCRSRMGRGAPMVRSIRSAMRCARLATASPRRRSTMNSMAGTGRTWRPSPTEQQAVAMELRTLAEGLQFPEGPVALDDGSVLLVEIAGGTLTRIAADGTKSVVARTGGGPNGAAVGPDGKCTIANNGGFEWHREAGRIRPVMQAKDYSGGRIQRVDPKTGAV